MKSLILATLLVASVSVQAQTIYDRAEVISAREIAEEVNRPSERCWVESTERLGTRERSPAGAITGAIVGGILGNQVGGGSGRDIATGVGLLAGAAIGDNMANQNAAPSREAVRRCAREDRWTREVTGYDVTYRYGGKVHRTVMPHHPGRTIDVEVQVTPVIR